MLNAHTCTTWPSLRDKTEPVRCDSRLRSCIVPSTLSRYVSRDVSGQSEPLSVVPHASCQDRFQVGSAPQAVGGTPKQ